jgi:hypothetical protein
MAQVGSLVIDLQAQVATFESNMQRAAQTLNSQALKMQRSLAGIERQAATVGNGLRTLAGAAAVTALAAAGKRALDYASSLGETAQQLGVTTRDLQVYRYAASQVGIEQETMDKGLAKLTLSLGQASVGAAKPSKAFDALGISVRDSSGHVKTAGEVIPELADKLAKVQDPAQRAAVEVALFGKAGQQLDTLLSGGRKAVLEYAAAAERLGLVLSNSQLNRADELSDKLAAMNKVLEVNLAGIVADNAGAILQLANAMGQAAAGVAKFMATNPKEAFALLGGLAGLSIGRALGPYGAGIGLVAGAVGGYAMAPDPQRTPDIVRSELQSARDKVVRLNSSSPRGYGRGGGGIRIEANPREKSLALANLRKLTAEYKGMILAPPKPGNNPPALGGLDLPDFLSGGGGGSKKPKTDPSIRNNEAFQSDLARLNDELLQAKRVNITDLNQIAEIDRQQVNIEADKFAVSINADVAAKKYTVAMGQQLLEANEQVRAEKLRTINVELASQQSEELAGVQVAQIRGEMDLLRGVEQISKSSIERQAIALRLVEDEFRIERITAEQLIASESASKVDKEEARIRLATLESRKAIALKLAREANQNPLEAAIARRTLTLPEISDRQLQLLADQLDDLDRRTQRFADDFAGAFGRAAQSALELKNPLDIVRNLLGDLALQFQQEFIIRPFTDFVRRKAGAPLAEKLMTDKIGGEKYSGLASDLNLTAAQVNAAYRSTIPQIEALGRAAGQTSIALGGAGSNAPSVLAIYGDQGPLFDANQQFTGAYSELLVIDPALLAAANDNLNLMSGAANDAAAALQAQIPLLGDFGSGLTQLLSLLLGAGGGGGLGSFLNLGLNLAGSAFGGGGDLFSNLPAAAPLGISSLAPLDIGNVFDLGPLEMVGFASGGFTGPGGKFQPAGVVHAGEYVINAEQTRKHLPLLQAINDDAPGFASGGLVGINEAALGVSLPAVSPLELNATSISLANVAPNLDGLGSATDDATGAIKAFAKELGGATKSRGGAEGSLIPAHQTSAGLSGLAPLLTIAAAVALPSIRGAFGGGAAATSAGTDVVYGGNLGGVYAAGGLVEVASKRFDVGGRVTGPGTATSDSVPAWLSAGEYVIRAAAVQKFGIPFLDAVNKGDRPRFAIGGPVASDAAAFADGGIVAPRFFSTGGPVMPAPRSNLAIAAQAMRARGENDWRGPLIGQMVFPGVTNAKEARETANQAAGSIARQIADQRRRGLAAR